MSGRHIDKLSPSGLLAIKEIKVSKEVKVHPLDIERKAKILIGLLLFARTRKPALRRAFHVISRHDVVGHRGEDVKGYTLGT